MKVKLGDVGMKEMSIHTIEECFYQIRNGANIKQGVVDGGYPITRIETTANDKFNRDRMGYAGITDIKKYESYVLEDGDLLMSHINSVQYLGRTVLYEKQGDEKIIHGMNLLGLKANRDILKPAYARYYFYSRPFREQVGKITKKSVNQASFAVADLKKIKIKVPDLAVQEEVVEILNRLNCVIEERQQELQKMDELIRARFVEMFGDPVSNSKGLQEATLPEIGIFGRGVSKHRPRNDPKLLGGKYPLIQTGDVAAADLYILSYTSTYSDIGLAQSKIWNKGTLCITIAANIAKTAILDFDACFPDSVVGFMANDKTNNVYIHYWFSFFQRILEEQAPESAQKNINLKVLSELKVICPEKEEQDKFADFVAQIDKSKATVQKALDETQLLFDSLMQQYFG